MKLPVVDMDNKKAGELDLTDATFADLFGREVRKDILHRAVNWQLAKRRSGNHKTKEIGDISGTTKKPYAQKGTGNARQGSLRSPQFRGGATIFGPVVRSHAHDLTKKFRKLALKTALSAKHKDGQLVIWKDAKSSGKTKELAQKLKKLGWKSALVIDGTMVDEQFRRAVSNIPHVDVLPSMGANVYDILRREKLVLTEAAVNKLVERLA